MRRSHLEEVVNLVSPGTFESDETHIRALQPEPAKLRSQDVAWPPPPLWTGRSRPNPMGWWRSEACSPKQGVSWDHRRSGDGPTPGQTAGPPGGCLVIIQAQNVAKKGVEFFSYGEGLFLSGAIGPDYLQLPPAPKKPEAKPASAEKPATGAHPGSVWLDIQGPAHQTLEREGSEKRSGLEARGQGATAAEEG